MLSARAPDAKAEMWIPEGNGRQAKNQRRGRGGALEENSTHIFCHTRSGSGNHLPNTRCAGGRCRQRLSQPVKTKSMKAIPSSNVLILSLAVLFAGGAVSRATNNFPYGWCTWGAAQEFDKYAPAPGIDWRGDAGKWVVNARAKGWVTYTDPRKAEVNALIVWTNGEMGHVGIVSQVLSTRIVVKEMNWGAQKPGAERGWTVNAGIPTTRVLWFSDRLSSTSFKFAGFIMPRKTAAYVPDAVLDAQAIKDMKTLRATNRNFGDMIPNTLNVNKRWQADAQLRTATFYYWVGKLTVSHATRLEDPKIRFLYYYEPLTKRAIGWTEVR